MLRPVTHWDDLKTAAVLAAAFAVVAAITVPFLLEVLPPDARTLPLPVPVFSLILAVQLMVVYGLLSWAGLGLARKRQLEPAPLLTSFWTGQRPVGIWPRFGLAFGSGLLCGAALVAFVAAIQRWAPQTFPQVLHPPSALVAVLASTAAALGEELLFRLFVLSALLRILPRSPSYTVLAVVASAFLFGAAHAPAFVYLFGGFQSVPPLAWMWLITLNGLIGIVCGTFFIKTGIGGAVLVHFGTDVVWHVGSQLGTA